MHGYVPLIMVVDDCAAVLDALSMLLQCWGYRILPAKDGSSALGLAEACGPIDALVTDYRMPGMSGLELMHRLRSNADETIPSVLLTAEIDIAELHIERPPNLHVLTKPADTVVLAQLLQSLTGYQHAI